MSNAKDPIRVDMSDLYCPQVEDYLSLQQAVRRDVEAPPPQSLLVRIFYSSWFYLSLASGLGAFLAWAVLEPFFVEGVGQGQEDPAAILGNLLIFPTVAGCIGLFLGAAEGIMCRNPMRAFLCGAAGLGIGFAGGLIAIFAAGIIFMITQNIAISFWKNPQPNQMPTGIALLILIMGRAAAWSVASIPAGLGQGIALRERKIIFNGLVGAVLGGLLGGLLFDPISILFAGTERATVSRCVGFTTIGLMVGLFVGLVEGWTKTAWLLMRAGPLAGKQFVLFRDTTVLGSSPKADVYLFKDEAIEPRHAVVYNRGGRFEIQDCDSRHGIYVNGAPVKRQLLRNGDQVMLGKTMLEFQLKESQS